MRKMLKIFVVAGSVLLIILIGLFAWSGGKPISLEYADFPQSELEKLIVAGTPEVELTLSGPLEVEGGSRWTSWAMKLLPGTFLVDVKINGSKASLVVDSGSSHTALSPQVAVAAQVLLTGPGPTAQHWGKEIPSYLGQLRELDLAGLKVHNFPVVVFRKQPVLKVLGLPIYHMDGLLGMDLLEQLAMTLDYKQGMVSFRREPLHSQASSASLSILRVEDHPFPIVECFIDGAGPFPCFIDTGTSAPVFVSREVWKALGLEGQKETRLRQLKLGELELKDVPAQASNVRFTLIGSNIFQAQGFKRLTLDFLAGKLYAER